MPANRPQPFPPQGQRRPRRRGSIAGLLLTMVALFAQVAAAIPLAAIPVAAAPTTALGIALPVCGEASGPDGHAPAGQRHDHLLTCARCLCCHAPAIMPTAGPQLPLSTAVVYAASVVLPPSTAPPRRLAARPPPRAPPILAA